jgi:hypothetical protein
MKKLLLTSVILALSVPTALACSPVPSCWMHEGKDYLLSICKQHVHKPLLRQYMDEPDQIPAFAQACKKAGVTIKVEK